jgi:hypothetical protein
MIYNYFHAEPILRQHVSLSCGAFGFWLPAFGLWRRDTFGGNIVRWPSSFHAVRAFVNDPSRSWSSSLMVAPTS